MSSKSRVLTISRATPPPPLKRLLLMADREEDREDREDREGKEGSNLVPGLLLVCSTPALLRKLDGY